ncbi:MULTISPECIES: NAD(P)H:quinone oxidoreductase [Lentzea]|uniref:NAD(P)H dehydrogenase (Quinone) n=1 Tax=Lentzea albida TaxID=65499 RepID=A0A1H9UY17_9PSEU|nr:MULTISPECIES: NAD(P)H:quinone oxidoreductase [Lentzea]USX48325.1 NAD(P)H:quinone oxidoreductase [Lentzea sp. HUAS12]SES14375.1 NAD(P)H dehydrogenase (quinone) [Lentzea albida]
MERSVNVSVVYYSSTGTIHRIATEIAETAEKAGAEVRLVRAAELAPQAAVDSRPAWAEHLRQTEDVPVAQVEDVLWADAVLFGTPTRFGNMSAQLKQFIDTLGPAWFQGRLANKVYSAFTSGGSTHGGMETTIVSIHNMVCHFGGIIVPPGLNENPYGTSHVLGSDSKPVGEVALQSARVQADRVVRVARALKEV